VVRGFVQEIVLSDISLVKSNNFATPAFDSSSSLHGPSNYVFEIHCGETVYYVGENPAVGAPVDMYSRRNVVCSMRSGSGLEKAQSWETAIRQARLPLATKPSVNEPSSSAVTVASHQSGSESDIFDSCQYRIILHVAAFTELLETQLLPRDAIHKCSLCRHTVSVRPSHLWILSK